MQQPAAFTAAEKDFQLLCKRVFTFFMFFVCVFVHLMSFAQISAQIFVQKLSLYSKVVIIFEHLHTIEKLRCKHIIARLHRKSLHRELCTIMIFQGSFCLLHVNFPCSFRRSLRVPELFLSAHLDLSLHPDNFEGLSRHLFRQYAPKPTPHACEPERPEAAWPA